MQLLQARLPAALSTAVVTTAAAAASGGLLFSDVYQDAASGVDVFSQTYWRGNDLVTLFVAVPVFLFARHTASRGSWRAALVWLGMVYYLLYNYSFYLFGAVLNWFFPLYLGIALLAAALIRSALVHGVPMGGQWNERHPAARVVAGYMALLAALVTAVWTASWTNSVASGRSGTDEGEFIRTVAALDILLLATGLALGAGWLWRRRPWGRAFAVVLNLSTATYMLVLTVTSLMNARAGVDGAAGESVLWAILGLGCLTGSLVLMRERVDEA